MDNYFGLIFIVLWFALIFVFVAAYWKVFTKAGKPGWSALIPIYNLYIMLKIIDKPVWWIVLFFIPIANIIVYLLVSIDMAKAFGRSTLFGVIMLWLFSGIGYLILGFGKSTYVKGVNTTPAPSPTPTPAPVAPPTAPQTPEPKV